MPESTLTLLSSPGAKMKPPLAFCVEIGAPKSLIGRKELNRVLAAAGKHPRHIRASANRFRFGDSVFTSLGKIQLSDKTPPGVSPIDVDLDIVKEDVPALLGLHVLNREQLVADTVNDSLAHRTKRSMEDGTDNFIDIWSTPDPSTEWPRLCSNGHWHPKELHPSTVFQAPAAVLPSIVAENLQPYPIGTP